jgi:peptidoglycan/xylan/chitin deacetylase (PgdA/CDA1 family)
VLNYHRIGNAAECQYDSGVFSANEEQLSEEIAFLKRNFHIVKLAEVLETVEGKQKPHEAQVLLTFDDGYIDNFTKAFPILRAHGVQAVFFIPTMFIGTNHFTWWDRIAFIVKGSLKTFVSLPYPSPRQFDLARDGKCHVIDELLSMYKSGDVGDPDRFLGTLEEAFDAPSPQSTDRCFMNWDEVRALARGGMSIGAHSHTHEILAGLSEERQLEEVTKSKALLEDHLGTVVNALAYPVGLRNSFSSTTQAAAQKGNYRVAFSFYGGLNDWGEIDRYDIRRQAPTCSPFDRFELQTISAKATGRFWV